MKCDFPKHPSFSQIFGTLVPLALKPETLKNLGVKLSLETRFFLGSALATETPRVNQPGSRTFGGSRGELRLTSTLFYFQNDIRGWSIVGKFLSPKGFDIWNGSH